MKRKLWIVPALAALIALLCCGAATAEYAFTSFDYDTEVIFPDGDGVYRGDVSWEVNFVPTAIRIYRLEGIAYTTSELVRDLPGSATGTTLEAGHRYNLFIYYGDPDLTIDRVYQQFSIAQGEPSATVSQTVFPSVAIPDEKAAFTWNTNFTPDRIEIRNADTEALITTLPGTATGWDRFDRSVRYQIRFYHDDYHLDRLISIDESGWAFEARPVGGSIYPESTLRLYWATNFTPVKVEIGHKYMTGIFYNQEEYVMDATITTDLDRSMSYDVPHSFTESATYTVRAYYTSWDWVESVYFSIITRRPMAGEIIMQDPDTERQVGDQIRVVCDGVPADTVYTWQSSSDGETWAPTSEQTVLTLGSDGVYSVSRTVLLADSGRYFRLHAAHPDRISQLYSASVHVKPSYKVRYYPNGGSGTMDNVGAFRHAGQSFVLHENGFTPPERKAFAGWMVDGTVYQPGDTIVIRGDTNIYAEWTASAWQITFSKNGGSGTMDPMTVPVGGVSPSPSAPLRRRKARSSPAGPLPADAIFTPATALCLPVTIWPWPNGAATGHLCRLTGTAARVLWIRPISPPRRPLPIRCRNAP